MLSIFIPTIGGLGLFIYGMELMGDALERSAGSKLRDILSFLTKNKIMGILMGTIVTLIIQSSSATTVMTIGFVNAKIINLTQAFSVIIGANIGTTITSQIIAFNVAEYAPIAIAIGMLMTLILKDQRQKDLAGVILGFGILFVGMNMMSSGLAPLSDNPKFIEIMLKLKNPWLAVLFGFMLSTVLQSSSASMGVLLVLAGQGLLPLDIAFPIIIGENIGTTTTGIISSIAGNHNAKRAAFLHFFFNVFGAIIFVLLLHDITINFVEKLSPMHIERQLANVHTMFNIVTAVIIFPFTQHIIRLSESLIKEKEEVSTSYAKFLDERFLKTPAIATSQIFQEINRVFTIAKDNVILAKEVTIEEDYGLKKKIHENESLINILTREITDYVIKLSREEISDEQKRLNNIFIYFVNNLERIGDHVMNITDTAEAMERSNISFGHEAKEELEEIYGYAVQGIEMAQSASESFNYDKALVVLDIESKINKLEKTYTNSHIERMEAGYCTTMAGVNFIDILSNLERISDHCNNIAEYIIDNNDIKIHI